MHEETIRTLGTLAKMKRLIINADDFGLAPGVNRAIVELQQAGALSSTTLMATAAYFSPAVFLALRNRRWGSAATWYWSTAHPACAQVKFLRSSILVVRNLFRSAILWVA